MVGKCLVESAIGRVSRVSGVIMVSMERNMRRIKGELDYKWEN
jgi:hypothetical protein